MVHVYTSMQVYTQAALYLTVHDNMSYQPAVLVWLPDAQAFTQTS